MQSIFAPPTAARVRGVSRNAGKRQGSKHGRLARNRSRLEHASTAVGAHESWINRGGYRNSAGEWCCGDNDCESPGQIAVTGKGWVIGGKEFVPFDEATPSPDGKIWICRRPDHTRRCVFGPPPGS
jgi:hypothetical protein